MPQWPIFFANQHEIRTRTGDSRDLVVLSGHAGFHFRGSGGNWRHDEFLIWVGPVWVALHSVAPLVTISAVSNDNDAVNAGWAIDWCSWDNFNGAVLLRAGAAVRDSDGWLLRVAYHATCIGQLA